jgi:hypothetical protein
VGGVGGEQRVSESINGGIEVVLKLNPSWKRSLALDYSVHQKGSGVWSQLRVLTDT